MRKTIIISNVHISNLRLILCSTYQKAAVGVLSDAHESLLSESRQTRRSNAAEVSQNVHKISTKQTSTNNQILHSATIII